MNSISSEGPLVERLAEEFLERQRSGEKPTIEEYCRKYPELEEQIRSFFPALVLVEDLKPGSDDVTGLFGDTGRVDGRQLDSVGDYRIIREIGRGGMGVVYEAEQESLGRRVALKVLPRPRANDQKSLQRFEREVRAAARMHHTNIVPVFDVGEDDEWAFYAMQLIQGQALDHVIDDLMRIRDEHSAPRGGSNSDVDDRQSKPPANSIAASLVLGRFDLENLAAESGPDANGSRFTPEPMPVRSDSGAPQAHTETVEFASGSTVSAALPGQSELSSAETNRRAYFQSVSHIGLQTARALSYAHARGIIHRDIKPSNLLLDNAGTVWVTDFGLAKTDGEGITHTGDILGTIRYMSPERFRGQCDVRADVYSLGLTLYELLALRPAFSSSDRLKLVHLIAKTDPEPLRTKDPEIPRDLETVVFKCIDKDPKRRYQSADELAEDLRRFIDDEPIKARRFGVAERIARWARRNRGLAATLGALLILLIVSAAGSSVAAFHFNKVANQRDKQRQKALSEQAKAEAARAEEARQRSRAEAAREEEARQRNRAEDALYAARTVLSQSSLNAEDPLAAANVLDKCRPAKGDRDRRGWEWHYLRKIANAELNSFRPQIPVSALDVSPDGRFVASAGGGSIFQDPEGHVFRGQVVIQNLESGNIVHVLSGHDRRVEVLCYSPDGRRLATGGLSDAVQIWSTETGKTIMTIKSANQAVHRVGFSPDGRSLAIAGANAVEVWDAGTGKILRSFAELDFVFDTDGKRLFLLDAQDSSVRIVETATGKEFAKWKVAGIGGRKRKPVRQLALSPTGHHLAVLGAAVVGVSILDVATGEVIQVLHHVKGIRCMAFSTDGKQIATGGSDYIVRLWDVVTGKQRTVLFGHNAVIKDLAFTSNGRRLVSADFDGYVKTWDPRHDPRYRRIETPINQELLADMNFAENGSILQLASPGGKIEAWQTAGGEEPRRLQLDTNSKPAWPRFDFAFSPGGEWLAGPTTDAHVAAVWSVQTGMRTMSFEGHGPGIAAVAWNLRGNRVATGGSTEIKLWNVVDGKPIQSFQSGEHGWGPLAISPDDRVVAMAGFNGVVLWDVRSGRQLHLLPLAADGDPRGLAFNSDGTRLASADYNHNTVVVWEPSTAKQLFTLPAPRLVSWVAFSPDGSRLAAVGSDGEVHLWDAVTGHDLVILRPDIPPVNQHGFTPRVAFSQDGSKIAASSWNGTITIWDAEVKRAKPPRIELEPSVQEEPQFDTQSLFEELTVLVKQRPKDALVRYQYASLLELMGRLDEAVASYRVAIELDEKQAEPYNSLAWLLVTERDSNGALRDVEEGLRLAQIACELAPDDASNWNTLGVAHYRNAQWEPALGALLKSDTLESNSPFNSLFLAMTHWRLGNKDAARSWHDQALKWRDAHGPDEELLPFYHEAAELLGR